MARDRHAGVRDREDALRGCSLTFRTIEDGSTTPRLTAVNPIQETPKTQCAPRPRSGALATRLTFPWSEGPWLPLPFNRSTQEPKMIEFTVPSITCGHCVRVVTNAIEHVDARARVEISLPTRRVIVETQASQQALRDALTGAGYPPQ